MAYSEKEKARIITEICDRVCEGEALRNVLKDDGMIDGNTFYRWVGENEDKREQYARACEERQDFMFEQMLRIADNQENDVYEKDGIELVNHNVINRSKLRIETRKWALSKLNPKKYGDKTQTEHSGEIKTETLTPEERTARIDELIKLRAKK